MERRVTHRDQYLISKNWQGTRERVPPLPQITTSTLPLGKMVSQRTHHVQCGPLAFLIACRPRPGKYEAT
jgi:hypothetical protein